MAWNSSNLQIMHERVIDICQSEFNMTIEQAVAEKKMAAVCRVLEGQSEELFGRRTGATSLYEVLKKNILSGLNTTQIVDDGTGTTASKSTPKMMNRQSITIDDAIRIGRTIEVFEKFGITLSFNS